MTKPASMGGVLTRRKKAELGGVDTPDHTINLPQLRPEKQKMWRCGNLVVSSEMVRSLFAYCAIFMTLAVALIMLATDKENQVVWAPLVSSCLFVMVPMQDMVKDAAAAHKNDAPKEIEPVPVRVATVEVENEEGPPTN